MAILSTTEQQQNENFINEFLAKNYSNVIYPEAAKQAFLDKCKKQAIWLLGLSPAVQKPFVEALTLAIQDTQGTHTLEDKIDVVFQVLSNEVAKENAYLKWQFQQNAGYAKQEQPTISWCLANNKRVPDNYLLQTNDVFNALAPLRLYSEIYVHIHPVSHIDANVEACVTTALKINKAKVAYVPVENGGHWTLEIYTLQNDGKIKREHYNPPGDGKCGDHTLRKICADAQRHLSDAAAQDFNTHFNVYDNNSATSSTVIRQQTIRLVQKGEQLEELLAVEANPITHTKQTAPVITTTNSAINAVTTITSNYIPAKTSYNYSELDTLFRQWNALANHVIDNIQSCSDAEREAHWNQFYNHATTSLQHGSWNPDLFHRYQCTTEAKFSNTSTQEEADVAEAMRRSLLVS